MKFSLLTLNPKILVLIALLLIGMPLTLYLVKQQQDNRQLAWSTDQSAIAQCDSSGKVVIAVRFTNTESNNTSKSMNIVARDMQSANEVNLGTAISGETKNGTIQTNQTVVIKGTVVFTLTWANGSSGSDSRSVQYEALGSCPAPSNVPPTPSVIPPTPSRIPPTPTVIPPTPSRIPPTPSRTSPTITDIMPSVIIPSDTLIPTILLTPSTIPPTIVLPTLTGVSGCPVPKEVQNVKIICPFCQE
jgi:hypothetical protein